MEHSHTWLRPVRGGGNVNSLSETFGPVRSARLLCPAGATKKMTRLLSTGSAAGGYAAEPLHPWLQSDAPFGAFHP